MRGIRYDDDCMPGPRSHRHEPVDRDAYRLDHKLSAGTHCPDCGLVVLNGRWTRPEGADTPTGTKHICPACARVRDRYPAGVIDITGDLGDLGLELENLLKNVETVEREEHPLERLIELEVTESGLHASTTGGHLARRIGSALERQMHGRIKVRYGEENNLVRVAGTV